jgi:hypothetical protein
VGVAGAVIMPVSGFWLMIPFAPLLFGTASRLDAMRNEMRNRLSGNTPELSWNVAERPSS